MFSSTQMSVLIIFENYYHIFSTLELEFNFRDASDFLFEIACIEGSSEFDI